jgi:DNA-binding NarL/FixJ family response regulator
MIRILLVDDFEPWRRCLCSMIQKTPELKIICEVSDGPAAIQKANELKPDLILLDIGLPELNGIEAARRIRQLSPSSKILFLTTDNSQDVVQAALSTGAEGYVHKARARKDLLCAIEAIRQSERSICGTLKSDEFTDTNTPLFIPSETQREQILAVKLQ